MKINFVLCLVMGKNLKLAISWLYKNRKKTLVFSRLNFAFYVLVEESLWLLAPQLVVVALTLINSAGVLPADLACSIDSTQHTLYFSEKVVYNSQSRFSVLKIS
jgi:hypothetical protein